jgi:hypothetical protein
MKLSLFSRGSLLALAASFSMTAMAQEASVTAENVKTTRYSNKVIERPGVLPTHIFAANINNGYTHADKNFGTSIKLEYGLFKNFQMSLGYDGFDFKRFNAFEAKKSMSVGAKYTMWNTHVAGPFGAVQSIALKLPVHFQSPVVNGFSAELPTIFYTEKMALGLGGNLFNLSNVKPHIEMDLNADVWYGYQIFGDTWADVSTSFGQLKLNNPSGQGTWKFTGISEKWPVTLSLIHGINPNLDIKGSFGFDHVLKAGDTMKAGVDLVLRAGHLYM